MFTLARHSAFTPQDLQKMMGFSVGFDSIFDRFFDMDLTRDSGYPPYNIRKINEAQYVIEIALAGFSKDDIEVEVTEGSLTIRSKKLDEKEEETSEDSYVHKGIAKRTFLRCWTLSDDIFVKGADLKDGMLVINLEKVIPEEKKPRLITIGSGDVIKG
jgi:molecular chaperone IbpA|tara:strand:- start:933 stop:1406 length:474 start_codon:yes stop_codon:yes gene_type:complete